MSVAVQTNAGHGHMLTYTGKFFNILDPDPNEIDPRDLAHHLSMICRYNGAVSHPYSVAQHSVLVAKQFPEGSYERRWAILHDAPEAYIGDLIAPLKYSGHFEYYFEAEKRLMDAICLRFELDNVMPEEVDFVDKKLRGAEMRDLKDYDSGEETYDFEITPWLHSYAKAMFTREMNRLGLF